MGANSECCGGVELEASAAAAAESDGSTAVLRWERFVAKMAVRVLLVEADDSTRQIITALLRKCGYKVTAVSDGKKAWEVLEKKPHTVDLVLAEIDLPSISGYTLLTLIMEHEICKNIPVIMMSSQDSVSTVYGCMLRGAADFLVKPIRKNELTNLWQHVWRRQATGSEAQGSCSKPDIDTETENLECIQDLLQPNWDKSDEDLGQIKSCKEGIDFIGAFDDYINSSSNTSPNHLEFSPALDLSLNQFADKHRLNHSDGSAFTPYVNKGVHNPGLTFPIPVISPTDSPEKNESDECTHFSSATDQSGNSSRCSGRTQVQVVISTVECRKEEVPEDRSSQREAALTKFRLKRKDRCYEKKVRYESRKKLAEQRPRVKGQFVRRQPNELMITTAN